MSYFKAPVPECVHEDCPQQVAVEIIPRAVDLGGFQVSRVLPSKEKLTVGPFVFLDQAGPGEFLTHQGLDVRPHPHICLSTMTYLFQGRLEHRDTLGSHQVIEPGAVNLMTAGHGIAHSERTPQADRAQPSHLFGIQSWLALPLDKEEMPPSFTHYSKEVIPTVSEKGVRLHIATGEWQGVKSPVITQNDALFVECHMDANAQLAIATNQAERAIFIIAGQVIVNRVTYEAGRMLVLKPGVAMTVEAKAAAHLIILGGSPLEERRYLWWNFVASSKERIEQAKLDWRQGKFGAIPGDDKEFIPLPI